MIVVVTKLAQSIFKIENGRQGGEGQAYWAVEGWQLAQIEQDPAGHL